MQFFFCMIKRIIKSWNLVYIYTTELYCLSHTCNSKNNMIWLYTLTHPINSDRKRKGSIKWKLTFLMFLHIYSNFFLFVHLLSDIARCLILTPQFKNLTQHRFGKANFQLKHFDASMQADIIYGWTPLESFVFRNFYFWMEFLIFMHIVIFLIDILQFEFLTTQLLQYLYKNCKANWQYIWTKQHIKYTVHRQY